MPREAKFNFTPIGSIFDPKKEDKVTISIGAKGQLFFSKAYITKYNAVNKYVRFFVDLDKRALGWSFVDKTESFEEIGNKTLRCLKLQKSGTVVLSMSQTFKHFKIEGKKYSDIPVLEYKDRMYNDINYIIVPNPEVQLYPKTTDVRNKEVVQ